MATTDFSQVPDDQMEHIFGLLENNADFIPNVDERRAFVAEYFRRLRGGARPAAGSAAPNVQSNLEASATPIPVEPVAGAPSQEDIDDALGFPTTHRAAAAMAVPGGGLGVRNTPEDLAAYGEVVRDAYGRIIDRGVARRQAARAQGYQDPEQVAYNAATGVMPSAAPLGATVMVDGVEVPIHRDSLGNPMYDSQGRPMTTIGAERRAKEAADEARIVERVSREAQEEMQRYGDGTLQFKRYEIGPDGQVSMENGRPKVVDVSPSEWDARFKQIHGRSMTEAERKLAAQQEANLNQRRGMEQRQAAQNRALRSRPSLQQMENDADARRRLVATRAMLAGGSSGLRGGLGGNMGMFTALAMLNGVDPENMDAQQQALVEMLPITPDRAKIEAARNAQLTELGLRTAQGRGFQQPDPAVADAQAQVRRDRALAEFNSWYDNNVGWRAGPYTWDRHDSMVNFLMRQFGLSRAEAEAIAQSKGMPRGARGGAAPGAAPAPTAPPATAPGFFPTENDPGGLGTPM